MSHKENKMLKSLTLALLATLAFAADAPKEVKSPATILYEKAIADNAKDAERAYEAYQKALDAANKRVVAALEAAKRDLNNASKGKLTISERADAIKEIDSRIDEVKKGGLNEFLVAKAAKADDLLGDSKAEIPASKSEVIKMLTTGSWKYTESAPERSPGNPRLDSFVFSEKGTWTTEKNAKWLAGTWRFVKGRTVELTSTTDVKTVFTFEVKDGSKMVWDAVWTGTVIHVEASK